MRKFMKELGRSARKTVLNTAEKIGGKEFKEKVAKDLKKVKVKIC